MSDLIKVADWSGPARASVIFVHGLGGHPYDTWRRSPGDKSFWPLWLAEDIPGIEVLTLGYAAPPSNWLGTAMPLQDRVNNVRVRLLAELGEGEGPVCFVCHSLGGLIVKKLLLDLDRQKERDTQAKMFLDRVSQVVFLATPHTGSRQASLMETLRIVAWPSSIARVLVANDPTLRDINTSYRDLADARRATLQHRVFYETQDTEAGRIVEEASSDPGLPGEPPIGIDADHVSIVKPQSRSALQYVVTRQFVERSPSREGQGATLRTYPLAPFTIQQPRNLIPKAIRLAALSGIAFAVYLGLRAQFGSGGGSAIADCGSNAQVGSSWFSSVTINGDRDCRKDGGGERRGTPP